MNILTIVSAIRALSFVRMIGLLAALALGPVQIATASPGDRLTADSVAAYQKNINDLRTYFAEATALRETLRTAAEEERAPLGTKGTSRSATTAVAFAENHHAELVRLREVDAAIARATRTIQRQLGKAHFLDLEEAELLRARRAARDARGTAQEAAARQEVEEARQVVAARRKEVALIVDELIRDVKEQASEDLRKGN